MWLFGNRVDFAFGSGVWPLLGLLVRTVDDLHVPPDVVSRQGVSGGEWILVGLGAALDVATYAAKPAQSRYATAS